MYAQTPARRARQVVGDTLVLAWVLACVWAGRVVHGLVLHLAEPAVRLQASGTDMHRSLTDTGARLGGIPLAGEELRGAFDRLAEFGTQVSTAGSDLASTMHQLALALGLVTGAAPVLAVALPWLAIRLAFARRSAAAQRFIDADADLDLFALRALAHQPMRRLAPISDDPAGAWRRGESDVTRALALLELRSAGLRPPPVAPRSPGSTD